MSEKRPAATVAEPWEVHRGRMYAEAQAEASEARLDETEPGGKYMNPDGTFVDCDGRVVEGANKGASVATRGTHADILPPPSEEPNPEFPTAGREPEADEATAKAAERERKKG